MIRGMTGQASRRFSVDTFEIEMELRSVNSRYFEFRTKIPSQYACLELNARKIISQRLKRGKYDLVVFVRELSFDEDRMLINKELVKTYLNEMRSLSNELDFSPEINWRDLFALPQIFSTSSHDITIVCETILLNLNLLIDEMMPMLLQEGEATANDIRCSLNTIKASALFLAKIYPEVLEAYRVNLRERVFELTQLKPNEERLSVEIELYAMRTAVNEELVRLQNHISSMEALLNSSTQEESSKRMDFIAQEMNREANTIASKALNYGITEQTILIKSEIEKMREQFRNIV